MSPCLLEVTCCLQWNGFTQSLPRSSQLFRNWQRCYVPSRALPASWALVEALMGVAFSQQSRHLALLLALGFNCVLRTSEMLPLTHQHWWCMTTTCPWVWSSPGAKILKAILKSCWYKICCWCTSPFRSLYPSPRHFCGPRRRIVSGSNFPSCLGCRALARRAIPPIASAEGE